MPEKINVNQSAAGRRVIRVFVSSTFRDMQMERDLLAKNVFPQLRQLCEDRGVDWTDVDLRWGITSEEASEGKVIPLCLAEIDRSRPYFICLLGERYGWVPAQEEIQEDLLEAHPWLEECCESSVTEIEIMHAVLRNPLMADPALFYFRDAAYLHHLPAGSNPADYASESDERVAKLAKLKNRIRAQHAAGILKYAPRENYADPEKLGEHVLRDFTEIIDELFPETVPETLDQEAMRHEAYARGLRLAFIGRDELLRQINDRVIHASVKPLVVTGDCGCGKSALLAEWVARWRIAHPGDLIIQHYAGSPADNAGRQGLIRRILDELRRSFYIIRELPVEPGSLPIALRDWVTIGGSNRQVVIMIDALEQLSTDLRDQAQLDWLPDVSAPNVRIVVSSMPGKSLDALRRRGWQELVVPPFAGEEIRLAANAYFEIFGKKLPQEILRKLESTPAAANPLYLRTVLDELRQFGRHEELHVKAASYLKAPGLPSLFSRLLDRWQEDFGHDDECPDIVRRSLCFIACARHGLSESELLDVLGDVDDHGAVRSLPRRYWTPLSLATENFLAHKAGLLTFSNIHSRGAVCERWLDSGDERTFKLRLATYFERINKPTKRKLDELPALLRDTAQWERLMNLLSDLPTFLAMRNDERLRWELLGFWLALEGRYDPVMVYSDALSAVEGDVAQLMLASLLTAIADFLGDAGRYKDSEALLRRSLAIREQARGVEHPDTLNSLTGLARMLQGKGDYKAAEPLYRGALRASARLLGAEHPATLSVANNLADLLSDMGDYAAAEEMCSRVLEVRQRVLGPEDPHTLTSLNNLASVRVRNGNYAAAESLFRGALDGRERVLGSDHPHTLGTMNNLADVLEQMGNYEETELLFRRALAAREQVLGPDHPDTLGSMNNLALLLGRKGDTSGAIALLQRAHAAHRRTLGEEHPHTLITMNNLALQLERAGDSAGAEMLYRQALEASERCLGSEHPDTLVCLRNLADMLQARGDYGSAEPFYRRALAASERVCGPEHSDTLAIVCGLATVLVGSGALSEGERLLRRALQLHEQLFGPDHPSTLACAGNLAYVLCLQDDLLQAEPLLQRIRRGERHVNGGHKIEASSMPNRASDTEVS
jgi:tetratricopeptide (TPR) repeat protein